MARVLFFGMTGPFSTPPLAALLAAGVEVAGVVTPAGEAEAPLPRRLEPPPPTLSDVPLVNPYLNPNILHLAWDHHLPAWAIGSLADPDSLALLANLEPELIVVACFNRLFPRPLRHLPRYGCLNLHPSLLPAYRGPAPLFWQARQGVDQTGVTLHFLDEGVDSGDIVAQTAWPWPAGTAGTELEQQAAGEGGGLLVAALGQLDREGRLPRRPQPQAGANYFPWPATRDFIIPTRWPARRAFNFMCGAAGWPLMIEVDQEVQFPVRAVVSCQPDQTLPEPYILQAGELWVRFNPGVVHVRT